MPNETRIFAVGLTETEQRLLSGICAISQRRLRKLKIVDADEIESADVFLVDENAEEYAKYKATILNLSENKPLVLHKLLIFIDSKNKDNISLPRPIEWSRLPEHISNLLENHKRKKIAEIAKDEEADSTQAVIGQSTGSSISRILVVDDSIVVREQLKNILTEHGYLVTTASSGAEAIEKYKPNHYHRVLLDVVMPETDGYTICRKLRAIDKKTPIIMLTSKSSPFDKIRGKMAGCKAYLTKPVSLDKLLVKLHS